MPRGRTKTFLETPETNAKKTTTGTQPETNWCPTRNLYVRRRPINTANVVNAFLFKRKQNKTRKTGVLSSF